MLASIIFLFATVAFADQKYTPLDLVPSLDGSYLDLFSAAPNSFVDGAVWHASWSPPDRWVPDSSEANEDYKGMELIGTPGGVIKYGPKAVSISPGRTDVFVATGSPYPYDFVEISHSTWDGSKWSEFKKLPTMKDNSAYTGFSVVSSTKGQMHLVTRDASNYMFHIAYDGSSWGSWEQLGDDEDDAPFIVVPHVIATGKNSLGYFGLRQNNTIAFKSWDGSKFIPSGKAWAYTEPISLTIYEYIEDFSVSTSPDFSSTHLWAVLSNGTLLHASSSGTSWKKWEILGSDLSGLPSVVHRDSDKIDVAGRNWTNSQQVLRSFDGKQWSDWVSLSSGSSIGLKYIGTPVLGFIAPTHLQVINMWSLSGYSVAGFHKFNGTWFPKLGEKDEFAQVFAHKAPSVAADALAKSRRPIGVDSRVQLLMKESL